LRRCALSGGTGSIEVISGLLRREDRAWPVQAA
jgi:hypothetical protein